MSPIDVFVGNEPPGTFDVVVAPNTMHGKVEAGHVEELVESCRPALDIVAGHPQAVLLRDEFVALVRAVAAAEAVRRQLANDVGRVVARHAVSRPTVPGRLGEGLAAALGVPLITVGLRPVDRVAYGPLALGRAARWSRLPPATPGSGVVVGFGGPSELRALSRLPRLLESRGSAARSVDFALRHLGLPAVAPLAPWARLDAAEIHAVLRSAWSTPQWWGASWLPWVERSLVAMSQIVTREAAVFAEAGRQMFADASAFVTAKVRWARARALLAAARDAGVPTVATQHGIHADAVEWEGNPADVFGVAGSSFRSILERRGFGGRIEPVGAPFFDEATATHDAVVALRPVEGSVIESPDDHRAHLDAATAAVRAALGAEATVAVRAHPREHLDESARQMLRQRRVDVDDRAFGRLWVSVESSVVAQAALAGGKVVLFSLNDHQWTLPFWQMPGIWVARSVAELDAATRAASADDSDVTAVWSERYGVALGEAAASRLADVVLEVAQ